MSSSIYRDHTIVNTGRPAGSVEDPIGYLPVAVVTWRRPDTRRRVMHVVKSQKLYTTPEEASAAALAAGKAWVDAHLLER